MMTGYAHERPREDQVKRHLPGIVRNDPFLDPFTDEIRHRHRRIKEVESWLTNGSGDLTSFANGYLYFGLHKTAEGWTFREWAPNAKEIFLVGDFSGWLREEDFRLRPINKDGVWELTTSLDSIQHLDRYKLHVIWEGGEGERLPSYANYIVQDPATHLFCAQVWNPAVPYKFKNPVPDFKGQAPVIYEAHVGMAQIEGKVSTYEEFRLQTLPRIVKAGYNTLQLMAIQEHPYYGSFGYQVSNFFAPSSRFGTPDDLQRLIDDAHGLGLRVIMDIVHSHAVRNENEGLGRFDGTRHQYFHSGGKGEHLAWDTLCFDYSKPQVIHFLLSNCKYWIDVFGFDGFRFDGVTSMLYFTHGLGKAFTRYNDYFGDDVDEDAVTYLALANKLIHQFRPSAITIAEDMSGMPGLAAPFLDGGAGFDYRLSMGIPDFWIRTLKELKDEKWNVEWMWNELTNRRRDEKVISYAESHDQALVGDKTVIFHLIDAEMYWHMAKDRRNIVIDRGIALHKMIRLMTISLARGGYLNFMGNEFGHPEWIDFPREGNGWSYHYARRQWNLVDDKNLCYEYLDNFDKAMVNLIRKYDVLNRYDPEVRVIHVDDQMLAFSRGDLVFVFNFSPTKSYTDYAIGVPSGKYVQVLSSDEANFGGHDRVRDGQEHFTLENFEKNGYWLGKAFLYLPTRTALVLQKT
jgi:1,4-alpha-glucan branching enzyme